MRRVDHNLAPDGPGNDPTQYWAMTRHIIYPIYDITLIILYMKTVAISPPRYSYWLANAGILLNQTEPPSLKNDHGPEF